jgi:uncharacterized membrane protein
MNTLAQAVPTAAPHRRPAVSVRSLRERAIQTLWFEVIGLLVVAPLFAIFSGATASESLALLLLLSVVVTLWAAVYNTGFDLVERRLAQRAASNRPQGWRVLQAVGLETSAVVLTWPLIVLVTPLGWQAAFFAELGLTLAYVAYGVVFHLVFDRLRPVRPNLGSLS